MLKIKRNYFYGIMSILMSFVLTVTCFATQGVEKEMRGVWVATVYGLDYPSSGATTNEEKLKEDAIKVLDNAKTMGFNTIFLQVRPSGDALYHSEIFPWSKYLTGEQGKAPDGGFDPLKFWIEEAHKRGLELHAWLNPYRVTASKNDNNKLASHNPAVLNPELTLVHPKDGKIYYNPGIPETRALIVRGIEEIINHYDVDGIHLDDYFYPTEDTIGQFGDQGTFEKYGEGFEAIEAWRRNNNDLLVQSIHNLVEARDETLAFGVSPAGIWANKKDHPEGSETKGSQTYFKAYADTKGWVEKGYLDYILPQIYWEIGLTIADYEVLVHWWSDVVRDTEVELYIGQAAYKTVNNVKPGSAWEENQGISEIHRQLIMNKTIDNISGYSMYAYSTFLKNKALYMFIVDYHQSGAIDDNQEPVVRDVTFEGEVVVGNTLTAMYIYKDPLNRPETKTVYNWYISIKGTEQFEKIEGEHGKSLTVKQEYTGRKIKVEVMPGNDQIQGNPVKGDNGRNQVIDLGDVDKDGKVTYKDGIVMDQYLMKLITLDPQAKVAGNTDGLLAIEENDIKRLLEVIVKTEE